MLASWSALHGVLPPLQARPVAMLTRATLPPVALMLTVPIASGAGSGAPTAPPEASCTR